VLFFSSLARIGETDFMRSPYAPIDPQDQPCRHTGHVFGRQDLMWRGNVLRSGGVTLAEIKPDPTWPNMWRVITPNGITDMCNLSRAVDAALALGLATLNEKDSEETPSGGPPARLNGRRVP
jgi:hypothetical protein